MVVIRRILLLAFVLAVPALMVALLYAATVYGLQLTNRTIDPQVLRNAAAVEFVVFILRCVPRREESLVICFPHA